MYLKTLRQDNVNLMNVVRRQTIFIDGFRDAYSQVLRKLREVVSEELKMGDNMKMGDGRILILGGWGGDAD